MAKKRIYVLRCCASCEWIFRMKSKKDFGCPKCGCSSYGAKFVHGKRVYAFKLTQQPWIKRKIEEYTLKLFREVDDNNKINNIKKDRFGIPKDIDLVDRSIPLEEC